MLTALDPARLAAMLRGTSHVPAIPDVPAATERHVLPRAVVRWNADAAQRDAARAEAEQEALRRATTPRAWIDGAVWHAPEAPARGQEGATAGDLDAAEGLVAPEPSTASTPDPINEV